MNATAAATAEVATEVPNAATDKVPTDKVPTEVPNAAEEYTERYAGFSGQAALKINSLGYGSSPYSEVEALDLSIYQGHKLTNREIFKLLKIKELLQQIQNGDFPTSPVTGLPIIAQKLRGKKNLTALQRLGLDPIIGEPTGRTANLRGVRPGRGGIGMFAATQSVIIPVIAAIITLSPTVAYLAAPVAILGIITIIATAESVIKTRRIIQTIPQAINTIDTILEDPRQKDFFSNFRLIRNFTHANVASKLNRINPTGFRFKNPFKQGGSKTRHHKKNTNSRCRKSTRRMRR
jgi:hypothetical protein